VDDALSYLIGDGEEDKVVLVSPDAGAYKKVYDVAKEFKIKNIITATKVRDMVTGNILRTEIPILDQHNDLMYVIVDDICDGGRTFVELAKVIKEGRPTAKVYLVVTHGIFSAGFKTLNEYIDGVFCTNSYRDVADNEYEEKTNVRQLKVI
jgi:ribose-phosphate pyrophosphokinase